MSGIINVRITLQGFQLIKMLKFYGPSLLSTAQGAKSLNATSGSKSQRYTMGSSPQISNMGSLRRARPRDEQRVKLSETLSDSYFLQVMTKAWDRIHKAPKV